MAPLVPIVQLGGRGERAKCVPPTSSSGQIQLILGPMFSGKSTELIRRLKRYQVAQYAVLIVKYAKDQRYDESGIATHCGQVLPAVSANKLSELQEMAGEYDVIGIDEGQFFPDIVSWCEEMANRGKIVLVAALDGTFQRLPFPEMLALVPLAEAVTKLQAVCMVCFQEAAFSKRITEESGVEVIGGADKYMAVCRRCYFSPNNVAASPRVALKQRNSCPEECSPNKVPKKALFEEKENQIA